MSGHDTGPVIRTTGLRKVYGQVVAVDGIDLVVERGEIYGFLGANGSGKTTTVRCLLGLVLATAGEIELLGHEIPKHGSSVLHRVGALVEGPAAYGHLSGATNLSLLDASARMPRGSLGGGRTGRRTRVREAMERVGLGAVGSRQVSAYSLGMRQRLGIAAALLRQPELLVLDEPTNGLDPQGIREVRTLLTELNASGTTVFLSSHLLAEVEQLCTRVGMLDRGRLVLQELISTLRAPTGRTHVRTPDPDDAVALLDGRVLARDGDRLLVHGVDPVELNRALVAAGVRVSELGPERHTLEDVIAERTSARQAGEVGQ